MSGSKMTRRAPLHGLTGQSSDGHRIDGAGHPQLAEAIVANCSSGIAVLVGPNLVCELVNPAFQALASGKEMLSRPFAEAWPDISAQIVPKAREVLDTGVPCTIQDSPCRFRSSPEAPVEMAFLSFTYLPLRDSFGQYDALLVLVDETTTRVHELQRAEAVAAELEAAVASATAGIVVYDPHGRVLRMNAAAETLVDHTVTAWSGSLEGSAAMSDTEAPDGSPWERQKTPTARALRGETVSGEIMALSTRDGKTFSITAGAAPVVTREGTVLGAVFAFADITHLYELQAQREEVIRMISHDLRQPLTPIMGHASILQRKLAIRGLDQEVKAAEAILNSARRMDSMVQELVDSVRLDGGTFELHREPTDLCYLVTDLAGRVGTSEEQEWLRVECPEPLPPLPVDWERIERAITNLITNAFRHSPARKPVTVRVVQSAEEIVISVIDQGAGISPEEQKHIFDRLYQTGSGKKAGGLGLGLSITRQIVEAHGGRIWVESNPGEGSTFSLSLPLGGE